MEYNGTQGPVKGLARVNVQERNDKICELDTPYPLIRTCLLSRLPQAFRITCPSVYSLIYTRSVRDFGECHN